MESEFISQASKSCAQHRSLNARPIPIHRERDFLACDRTLLAQLRIVLDETCRSFLRIRELLKPRYTQLHVQLQIGPEQSAANWDLENRFLHACIQHTLRLQRDINWVGMADLSLASQSFRNGALWALDICGKEISSSDTAERVVP